MAQYSIDLEVTSDDCDSDELFNILDDIASTFVINNHITTYDIDIEYNSDYDELFAIVYIDCEIFSNVDPNEFSEELAQAFSEHYEYGTVNVGSVVYNEEIEEN